MNQETNQNQSAQQGAQNAPAAERTFTQAQLDAIVADRLNREKAKYADYETLKDKAAKFDAAEEAGKTELQKANDKAADLQQKLDRLQQASDRAALRDKVAAATKLPTGLAEFLTADDEEGMTAQAKRLLEQVKPGSYPTVPDGGSPQTPAGGGTTRDQFADWFQNL